MSPKLGTSGQWWASTADGNFSISENATASQPSGSHATDAASIPLHVDKNFIELFDKLEQVDTAHLRLLTLAIQRHTFIPLTHTSVAIVHVMDEPLLLEAAFLCNAGLQDILNVVWV